MRNATVAAAEASGCGGSAASGGLVATGAHFDSIDGDYEGGHHEQLACRDAGFDCDAVVEADTDEAVMGQVQPHAQEAHWVEVTPEMERQLAGLVRQR